MDAPDQNLQASNSKSPWPNRTISVQSFGEVRCPPDLIQFGVSVCSSKESVEAAQASVKRRADYILQVLRNSGIKEKSYKCSTDVTRKDDECYCVQTSILIECDSLVKCETVRNLLIQKLDSSSVQFTPITCRHSFENKEEKRQEAFKRAVVNARSKAQSVSLAVGVQLGPAIEVTELSQDTIRGGPDSMMDVVQEPASTNLHVKFAKETLIFKSQVSVVFESSAIAYVHSQEVQKTVAINYGQLTCKFVLCRPTS